MKITSELFGHTSDGTAVERYTLTNEHNHSVSIITYGGIITAINVPSYEGSIENVVLGFNSVKEYETLSPYYGAITGRFAGRISEASFDLNGKTYNLAKNDGENCLHGGLKGLDKVVWSAKTSDSSLILSYLSPDLEENFPGNLDLTVTYTWSEDNILTIDYHGTADQPTYLNLTNHTYFNLTGNPSSEILDHELMIDSSHFVAITANAIPFEIMASKDTSFDFRTAKPVGRDIHGDDSQLRSGLGYDHPFILDHNDDIIASLYEPSSRRFIEVLTSEKYVVCYSGNHMKKGYVYDHIPTGYRCGICLETQDCPDHMHFSLVPSKIYGPDNAYQSKTQFKFSVK